MIANIILWVIWGLNSLFSFFSSSSSSSESSSSYSSNDCQCFEFLKDCIERGQCGVADGEQTESRCCDLARAQYYDKDYLGFGHRGDKKKMTQEEFAKHSTLNFFIQILTVSAIIFILFGLPCLLFPESVVFNNVITDEYRSQLGLNDFQIEEKRKESEQNKHKESIMQIFQQSLDNLGHVFSSSSSASTTGELKKEDLEKAIQQLKYVQESIIYTKPEAVSMTTPTRLVGGFMLFYAIFCLLQTKEKKEQLLSHQAITIHLIWFACSLIAVVVAAVGHGNHLTTSWITITLVTINVIGFLIYCYLERKITIILTLTSPSPSPSPSNEIK